MSTDNYDFGPVTGRPHCKVCSMSAPTIPEIKHQDWCEVLRPTREGAMTPSESGKEQAMSDSDEVTLVFMTNGDGTFNCTWCEQVTPNELVKFDDGDDPICPGCYQDALDDLVEERL